MLGIDDHTQRLARVVVEDRTHELVRFCDVSDDEARRLAGMLGSSPTSDWESLLDSSELDVVIVARGSNEEARLEQLRKLIASGVTIVISHPLIDSILGLYELEMIREEAGAVVLPFVSDRWHPAIGRVNELFDPDSQATLGRLEQIVMERTANHLSRDAVRERFLHDVDLLRAIAGEITKVGAMSPGGTESFENLGVQLSGPRGVLIRWSSGHAATNGAAVLTLHGSQGTAVLAMPEDSLPWRLEYDIAGETHQESFEGWSAPAAAIARLERARGGDTPSANLLDSVRALEVAEAVDRSLARGKTVELNVEETSEGDAFRGDDGLAGMRRAGGWICLCLDGLAAGDHQ